MGISDWNGADGTFTKDVLIDAKMMVYRNIDHTDIVTIKSGRAKGRLVGGNLSVFVSMLGSKYLPHPKDIGDYILFLEDVDEAVYRIDRMLTQLHLAEYLEYASGIVFGRCTSCSGSNFDLEQILQQKLGHVKVPTFTGAMIGHIDQQFLIPIGLMAEIDADNGTISLLEAPVV
eukprot:TRINITY_DN6360_c0_g1_i2.p1 TRINITY_DN6360_c0_g1~~TRINITY_DN6360_c0_g1_i2.p1  ORF type:complete len:174 (-),score=44.68 TRINITY_DN6360_c0_g1_i2:69-590(-)